MVDTLYNVSLAVSNSNGTGPLAVMSVSTPAAEGTCTYHIPLTLFPLTLLTLTLSSLPQLQWLAT